MTPTPRLHCPHLTITPARLPPCGPSTVRWSANLLWTWPPALFEEAVSESPEPIKEAETWLQQVDAQIQVHQLRQFLQTTPLANEIVLRHLFIHHLHKPSKSTSDRDKTDFLLVQYFSLCAPSGMEDPDIDLDYVAQVLEPVLGPQEPVLPAWLKPLETVMESAARCKRLSELLHGGTLEQGRKLKSDNAAHFFEPSAMAAFARFSFMIRRIFFRLMHEISTPFRTVSANSNVAMSRLSIAVAPSFPPKSLSGVCA